MLARNCAARPATVSDGAVGGIGEMVAQGFQPLAFLGEAGGNRFAAHGGAGAGFVQSRDLIFQRIFQRAQPAEGAVQPGIQGIQFAAHGAAQHHGAARGGVIGGEKMFGGGLQRFGGAAHLAGAAEGGGDGDEQKRRQRHGGGEQGQLLHVQLAETLRPEIAPEIGAPHPDPEGRQHGGKGQGGGGKARRRGAAPGGSERGFRRPPPALAGCSITG